MNVDRFMVDNTLVWTLTSHGYQFFTQNLILNLKKRGIKWNLCVVCADDASYQFMIREGISAVKAPSRLPDFGVEISPFGSSNFQRLNLVKLACLDAFANDPKIQNCIYMDGDIAVYDDFLPDILSRLELSPLLFQCDEKERDITCCSNACPNPCTGFIAWKHGFDHNIFKMDNPTIWKQKPEDQLWVQHKLKQNAVDYMTLPRNLYPNGAFATIVGSQSEKEAYILHYNYRVGNVKKAHMKRFGDWNLLF